MRDSQYDKLPVPESTLGHEYGSFAHILSHPYAMSLLTRLCAQETGQPEFNHLVGALYDWLLSEVASRMLTREQT